MTTINTYLTFNGNCNEAMVFYKECLGGELVLQTIGESPVSDKMPKKMANSILHSVLTKGDLVLMGTDMCDAQLVRGNAVSMLLNCTSEEEIQRLYKELSAGGKATHPLEHTFFDAIFGNLTDKFGNHWLLYFNKQS